MTAPDGFDRLITAWLEEQAPMRETGGLFEKVTDRLERTRRLPGWALPQRWLPMQTQAKFGAVPRAVIVLATVALLTALAAGAMAVGSSISNKLPDPFGAAGNGSIAFEYDGDVYVVDPESGERRQITSGPDEFGAVSWSRDGTKLAYWSFPTDSAPSLYITDADGNDPTKVAEDPGTDGEPDVWSEDGHEIMFSTVVPGVGSRLYVAATDGSHPLRQVGDPDLEARSPALSPNGLTVAFGGGPGGGAALYVMQWDGSDMQELSGVSRTGIDAFLKQSWSLDGTLVATHDNAAIAAVWLVEADGSGATQLSDPATTGIYPSYAPDGSAILWGNFPGLTIWNPGDEPTSVVIPGIDSLEWSPDSTMLAGVRDGNLVILDRAGETIAELGPADDSRASWQRVAP